VKGLVKVRATADLEGGRGKAWLSRRWLGGDGFGG
jgi:hypothetical protein